MPRKSYIVSGRDLRIRPRTGRPEPGDPEHPITPPYPPGTYPPGGEYPYPPEDGDGDEEVGHPEIPIIPEPPRVPPAPGLYVGPTKGNPVIPVPPKPEEGEGEGEHVELPPGAIWPKPYGRVAGHYVALAYIPEHGWRYIVIDPDAWPSWEENGGEESAPQSPSRPGTQPGAPGGSRPTPSRST